MHTPDIELEIHKFVVANFLFGQPLELRAEDSLLGAGVIDSTGVLELVDFLKSNTITVEDEEVIPGNLETIKIIALTWQEKLAAWFRRLACRSNSFSKTAQPSPRIRWL